MKGDAQDFKEININQEHSKLEDLQKELDAAFQESRIEEIRIYVNGFVDKKHLEKIEHYILSHHRRVFVHFN